MIKLCEHNFCGKCLDQTWSGKINFCPECRVEFFSNDVGKSRILENLFADFIMKYPFEKFTENFKFAQYSLYCIDHILKNEISEIFHVIFVTKN